MKKLIYIYLLSVISLFLTHETNARDPFNGKTWEAEPEDHEQPQGMSSSDNEEGTSANQEVHEE